ncbi:gamma-secretase subunit PEN-2 isoform X1 [Lemur catta]|uniref:gamma-secretase subunit PEN-2 isoform X1 n=1 Tax=Lemur catta TaxID=9447 RepID=UPI001E267C19|nr:gamma-secretase subunit PEN-2 isoform X1 [Lemur catta]
MRQLGTLIPGSEQMEGPGPEEGGSCGLNFCVPREEQGGFAFLPFLWLVNIFWFFREAFLVPAYTEQSQIKGYVWRSAVGFLFWVIVLTTWITIFQIYRPRWGALGDYLSFTIPLGIP